MLRAVPMIDAHRRIEIQVFRSGSFSLGDLFHLLARHFRHLVAVRFRRTLHDSRGALQKLGSRRRLQNKRERAVAVDRDQHGNDHPVRLFRSLGVELLAEIHDVHAVRPERGAHGRRRRRLRRPAIAASPSIELSSPSLSFPHPVRLSFRAKRGISLPRAH